MESRSDPSGVPSIKLLTTGMAGGLFCGLFGVGGGIVIAPLLMWWARCDHKLANGTSLLAIAPMSILGALSFAAGGLFPWIPGLLVGIGAILGGQIGALILKNIYTKVLSWGLSIFALLAGVSLFWTPDSRGAILEVTPRIALSLIAIGLLMGIIAGIFGIGGGVVVVPALVLLFGVGDLVAKSISLLAIIPGALSGSLANLRYKNTSFRLSGWVSLGSLITVPTGTYLAFAVSSNVANALFGILMLLSAVGIFFTRDSRKH